MMVLGLFFRVCLVHVTLVLSISVGSPKDFDHRHVKRGTSYNRIDVSRYVAPANAKSTQRRGYSNVILQHDTTSTESTTNIDLFHAQAGAAHHAYRGLGQQSAYDLNMDVRLPENFQSASTYKFPRGKDLAHIQSQAVEVESPVSVHAHLYNRRSPSGREGKSSHIGPAQQSNTSSYILPGGLTKPSLNLHSVSASAGDTVPDKYERIPRKTGSPSPDRREEMVQLGLNQKAIRPVSLFYKSAPVPPQNKALPSESSATVSRLQGSFYPRAYRPGTALLRFSSPRYRPQGKYQPFQVLSNTSQIAEVYGTDTEDDDDDEEEEGSGQDHRVRRFKSVPTGAAGASVPGLLTPSSRPPSPAGSVLSPLSVVSPSSTWFQVFCARLNLCSGSEGGNKLIP